jgi:hypothetical membrane protein
MRLSRRTWVLGFLVLFTAGALAGSLLLIPDSSRWPLYLLVDVGGALVGAFKMSKSYNKQSSTWTTVTAVIVGILLSSHPSLEAGLLGFCGGYMAGYLVRGRTRRLDE